ncbi:hypothetical protein [Deinococcus sonorensis]|uniref:Uncharacterized protein n=2 Tax=Deinococcus sonorensis TaxID=309891 RepID=A0AAU7UCP8_9DEIO
MTRPTPHPVPPSMVATLACAVLSAAASSSTPLPPVTRAGQVSLTTVQVPLLGQGLSTTVTVEARFVPGQGEAAGVEAHDACTVQAEDPAASPDQPRPDAWTSASVPARTLDAGDPLTLRGAQPYALLPRTRQGQLFSYTLRAPLPQAPPPDLKLDIPGAAGGFPAMKGLTVPTVAPLALTAPAADDVTPDTIFRWSNPSRDPGALVLLTGRQDDGDLIFSCTAVDDGSFSFPAATAAELRRRGFTGSLTMTGRMVARGYRQNDAQLVLRVMRLQMRLPGEEGES